MPGGRRHPRHDVGRHRLRRGRATTPRHLYVGTSSWLSCHVPYKQTDPLHSIASLPSALPGRYLVSTEQQTAGVALSSACATAAAGRRDGFAELDELAAAAPPGSGGVVFTPWLNGERTPVDDHLVRGGLPTCRSRRPGPTSCAPCSRASRSTRAGCSDAVEHFCQRRLDPITFVGGGARSPLWAQIMADVLGRTIRHVADPVSANVRGAALLAWRRARRAARRASSTAARAIAETYAPDPARRAALRRRSTRRSERSTAPSRRTRRRLAAVRDDRGDHPMTDPARRDRRARCSRTATRFADVPALPEQGRPREEVLAEIEAMAAAERPRWEDGYASGAVYHGDPEHIEFLNSGLRAALAEQPAARRPVAERGEVRGRDRGDDRATCSAATHGDGRAASSPSGGTESILLAMKAYRDRGRARDRATRRWCCRRPRTPRSTRRRSYFGIEAVQVPVGPDLRADVAATAAAITDRTIAGRRLGAVVPARRDRPDRGARRARPRARHRLPHRRLPRRLPAAVGRAPRLPGAAVRLPPAGRDVDVGRHAQVRLRGQGHVGRALPRRRAAPRTSTSRSPTGRAGSTSRRRSPAAGRAR